MPRSTRSKTGPIPESISAPIGDQAKAGALSEKAKLVLEKKAERFRLMREEAMVRWRARQD